MANYNLCHEILRKSFDKYDFDSNGSIDVQELCKLFNDLEWTYDTKSLNMALAYMDSDNSATIDWEEFKKWADFAYSFRVLKRTDTRDAITTRSRLSLVHEDEDDLDNDDGGSSETSIPDFSACDLGDDAPPDIRLAVLKEAFEVVDTDRSGTIETVELKKLFEQLKWRCDDARLEGAMKILDSDNSGSIEWVEFKEWSEFAYNYRVLCKQPVFTNHVSDRCQRMSIVAEDGEESDSAI
eukprot:CFRG3947T1